MSDPVEPLEKRWAGCGSGIDQESTVEALDGEWRVERLSGPVPMPGVYKTIREGMGRTSARWSPFPDLPFRLERRRDLVLLVYEPPFSFLRDELRREAGGSWLGRATVAGRRYAWFRLVPEAGGE